MKILEIIRFKKVNYINPIDPAVNPTTRKNANSNRSLGKELTIKFS